MSDETHESGNVKTPVRIEEHENLDSITSFDSPDETNLQKSGTEPFQLNQITRQPNESLLVRLRVFLWIQHQPWIAGLLFLCLVGMTGYFIQRSYVHSGLIDLDSSGALSADFQVDINEAELGEIVVLPGVGKKLGQAIVDYRTQSGRFMSFQDLENVPGIGEKKLAQLVPYLVPFERD